MTRTNTHLLALNGVIAAAYAALTFVAAAMNLAYGPVQFRVSEALTVLPFLFPGTWPGLFVGCLVAKFNESLRSFGYPHRLGGHAFGGMAHPEDQPPVAGAAAPGAELHGSDRGDADLVRGGLLRPVPRPVCSQRPLGWHWRGGGMLSAGHAASPGTSQGSLPPALYSGTPQPRALPRARKE